MNIDKSDIKIFFIGKVLSEILLKNCNCKVKGGSDVVSVRCFGVRVSVMFH